MKGRPPFDVPPGSTAPPSSDPIALLNYALLWHPESMSLVNFAGSVLWTALGDRGPSGHGGEQGPPPGPHAAVSLPPEVRENLDGPPEEWDAYLLIHIARAVVDEMDSPAERPLIVRPPGVGRPT